MGGAAAIHIQSIRDVELFGIDTGNYGAFVLERPVWSARFGFSVTGLQLATLAPRPPALSSPDAGSFSPLAPPPTPRAAVASGVPGKQGGTVFSLTRPC